MPTHLSALANRFGARAFQREANFTQSLASTSEKAYTVICLYADWEEFSENLLTTSARLKPITTSGVMVSRAPGIKDSSDFRTELARVYGKKPADRFSVGWGTPSRFVKIATKLQVRNQATLVSAIASASSPADDLRVFRNFLAHRNFDTARQVRARVPRLPLTVDALVGWLGNLLPGGRTQFGVWCEDLNDVARASTR